jgi:NADH-quinone oxidoreductase subunit K
MFVIQILTNVLLFLSGIFGILLNRRNILIVLMCIEIILLSVNLNFIIFSIYLDDFLGQIFSLFVLTVAAAESAIGLAILILYYRVMGNISISEIATLKG